MDKVTAPRHPIRVASQRTGLTPATLRAWERRYGVVDPARSDGGQRLYNDEQVEKLTRLRKLTEAGRAISQVAELSDDEAKALLTEDREATQPETRTNGSAALSVDRIVDTAYHFVTVMNDSELEYTLRRAVVTVGAVAFLEDIVVPLMHRIGDAWRAGDLNPAQEHLAVQVTERVLSWLTEPMVAKARGPRLVVATLTEERHGLGTKLVAAAAAMAGWQVSDLGVDLPAENVVDGAETVDARAVALSLVNPAHNEAAVKSLRTLRDRLPSSVRVLVGGAAASKLKRSELPKGVETLSSLDSLRKALAS